MDANIEIREDKLEVNNVQYPVSDMIIYQKNKEKNIEKFTFFKFLIYNTKIESHLEILQSYLFWVGILEYFVWVILLALFISSPSNMAIIWIFLYHNARATVGLFIVKFIPKTHSVIENLKDYENSSLEDIQNSMEGNYLSLIHESERVLRPLLITYTVLTFFSFFVDIILFLVVSTRFDQGDYSQKNFILILGVIAFIISDYVYFSFIESLRYSFPPETLVPIRRAIFGAFSHLKESVANGFGRIIRRFSRRAESDPVQNQNQ